MFKRDILSLCALLAMSSLTLSVYCVCTSRHSPDKHSLVRNQDGQHSCSGQDKRQEEVEWLEFPFLDEHWAPSIAIFLAALAALYLPLSQPMSQCHFRVLDTKSEFWEFNLVSHACDVFFSALLVKLLQKEIACFQEYLVFKFSSMLVILVRS